MNAAQLKELLGALGAACIDPIDESFQQIARDCDAIAKSEHNSTEIRELAGNLSKIATHAKGQFGCFKALVEKSRNQSGINEEMLRLLTEATERIGALEAKLN